MPTTLHFLNVGQGNMVLCELANGTRLLYDCNVTAANEASVLNYLGRTIDWGTRIDIFVNSHRDADHMRGIKKVHRRFPVQKVWDSGVTGNTPDSTEYREYMELRRTVGYAEVESPKFWSFGQTKLRVLNAKNDELADEPNAQSIVIKTEHLSAQGAVLASAMLTGDTDAATWRYSIQKHYTSADLSSDILLASHHGSLSFFDDPADDQHYYLGHLKAVSPAMTIVSVGDNPHGHPESKALEFYETHSRGSNKGTKLKRTDEHGNIRLVLKDEGGWSLNDGQ